MARGYHHAQRRERGAAEQAAKRITSRDIVNDGGEARQVRRTIREKQARASLKQQALW